MLADPRRGNVVIGHGELLGVTEPSPDRLVKGRCELWPDICECWCPGSAVEVLVTAADSQVRTTRKQRHLHGTSGVADVPKHEGSDIVCLTGQLLHIQQGTRQICN